MQEMTEHPIETQMPGLRSTAFSRERDEVGFVDRNGVARSIRHTWLSTWPAVREAVGLTRRGGRPLAITDGAKVWSRHIPRRKA